MVGGDGEWGDGGWGEVGVNGRGVRNYQKKFT